MAYAMSDGQNALEVRGLGKRYRIGELAAPSTVRDAITDRLDKLLRRSAPQPAGPQDVWALRDLTLDVPEGTTLGIVGRNGAGKSTLLKVLARITEPTEGVSRTRGTVGSLLEVGTGFHPELSGRENVFLNAAILGMPRAAVSRQLDEIVEFAGVGRFLDTPVKRYSSGMYLRLAFAVAAHVEADVLLVDEVLAVGDAEFQRRCLGKMEDLGRSGRTVVFISHNLDAVTRLCASTLWLDAGRMRALGPTPEVVDAYLVEATPDTGVRQYEEDPDSPVSVRAVRVGSADGGPGGRVRRTDRVLITVDLVVRERVPGLDLAVSVETATGIRLLDEALSDTDGGGTTRLVSEPGQYRVCLTFPPLLMPGEYVVNVWSGTTYETFVWLHAAALLRLEGSNQARPGRLIAAQGDWAVSTTEMR